MAKQENTAWVRETSGRHGAASAVPRAVESTPEVRPPLAVVGSTAAPSEPDGAREQSAESFGGNADIATAGARASGMAIAIAVAATANSEIAAEFSIPVLDDNEGVEAVGDIVDALDHVTTTRSGLVVMGEKGAGKTFGVRTAIDQFRARERLVRGGARARIVILVDSPPSIRRNDPLSALRLLKVIHQAVTGEAFETRRRGERVEDHVLLEELVAKMLIGSIAALVFDEAENLTDAQLAILPRLVSRSRNASAERFAGGRYRAAGVGVLLVGTPALRTRIEDHVEYGERWTASREVAPLTPEKLSGIYRLFLPPCEARARVVGEAEWTRFVMGAVWGGVDLLSLRTLENHVRLYVRRICADLASRGRRVYSASELPFDEELFIDTFRELALPRVRIDDGSRAF